MAQRPPPWSLHRGQRCGSPTARMRYGLKQSKEESLRVVLPASKRSRLGTWRQPLRAAPSRNKCGPFPAHFGSYTFLGASTTERFNIPMVRGHKHCKTLRQQQVQKGGEET